MKNIAKHVLLAFLCWSVTSYGATWRQATNASRAALDAVIASASDGDVIYVPDDGAWHTNTTTLDITKALFIIAEGAKLADGIPATVQPCWRFESSTDLPVRFSGFMLKDGGRGVEGNNGNLVVDRGSNFNAKTNNWFRIDHCHFDHLNGNFIQILDAFGVIDHNTNLVGASTQALYGRANHYGGGDYSACCGHGSWTDPVDYSSDRFIFAETNVYIGDIGVKWWVCDGSSGMRLWQRFNTLSGGRPTFELGHGTDSGGERRGTRISIANNNTIIGDGSAGAVMDVRSGEAIVYDNVITNYPSPRFSLSLHRLHNSFAFYGGADGTNLNDANYAGGPFGSGVVATAGTRTLTVSGTPWTSGQWTNYTIQRTSSGSSTKFGYIIASTANSVTWAANSFSSDLAVVPGDTFQFWRVQYAMDMPGRTGGSLWTNSPSLRPGGWNNQDNTPCYQWNNANIGGGNPASFNASVDDFVMIEGVHFTNNVVKPGFTPYPYPHAIRAVSESIGISPSSGSVAPLATIDFDMTGGNGTNLVFHVWVNNSGASINASTGLYTAGPSGGVADTVRAWDTWGNYVDVTVAVIAVSAVPGAPRNFRRQF